MPIEKKAIYESDESNREFTMASFGTGDICVSDSSKLSEDGTACVFMKQMPPVLPIGTTLPAEKTDGAIDYKPDLVLRFSSVDSIDVVVEKLLSVKELLLSHIANQTVSEKL